MDKRTVLAVILSLLVLFIYSLFSPQTVPSIILQPHENKELFPPKNDVVSLPPAFANHSQNILIEKIFIFENSEYLLTFSSQSGALKKIFLKKFNYEFSVSNLNTLPEFSLSPFVFSNIDEKTIQLVSDNIDFTIEHVYSISSDYTINYNLKFFYKKILSKKDLTSFRLFSIFPLILDNLDVKKGEKNLEKGLYEYIAFSQSNFFRKPNAYVFTIKDETVKEDSLIWACFRDRYFAFIVKPLSEESNYFRKFNNGSLDFYLSLNNKESIYKYSSQIFAGPQDFDLLKKLNFDRIIDFQVHGIIDVMTFGTTHVISNIIYQILHHINSIIRNWGFSIIFLATLIFFITYPLTLKSMMSIKKMQALQPEIAKIREINKNNPEKLNSEIMELYKRNKFNPFSGCLPMFLQMPIFVSLYQVLWRSFDIKGQKFLWISDLSEADRLFIFPYQFPIIGNQFNLLPILVIILMFFQQRFSMNPNSDLNPAQKAQQQLMSKMMPIIVGLLFYNVSSGLCLYFAMFYFLSVLSLWKMRKIS